MVKEIPLNKDTFQGRGSGSMLSSVLSTSAMSATSMDTSMVSAFTVPGVSEMSVGAVLCLIALLCASEVLSSSGRSKRATLSLNVASVPLVAAFAAIVVFKALEVL